MNTDLNLLTREEIIKELDIEDKRHEEEVLRLSKLLAATFKVGDRVWYHTRMVDIIDIIILTEEVTVEFKCVNTGLFGWLPIRNFVMLFNKSYPE